MTRRPWVVSKPRRGPRRYACLREVLAEGYRILLGQGHDTYKEHFSDVSKEIVRNKTSSEKIGYTDTDLQAARERAMGSQSDM